VAFEGAEAGLVEIGEAAVVGGELVGVGVEAGALGLVAGQPGGALEPG
jgi:hypothetical protein